MSPKPYTTCIGSATMKHNYNSENKCVNCGAYRDAVMAGNLVCVVPITVEEHGNALVVDVPDLRPPVDGSDNVPNPYRRQENTMHIPISLGERIDHLRQAAGLSRSGAATVMGLHSLAEFEDIANDHTDPTSDQLMALAVETVKQVYKAYQER